MLNHCEANKPNVSHATIDADLAAIGKQQRDDLKITSSLDLQSRKLTELPVCVISSAVLSKKSIKPSIPQRDLETNSSNLKEKLAK